MATRRSRSPSKEKQTSEKTDYDPTLDFFSEQFDPLKALQTPGLVPPVPDAITYENISKYQRAYSTNPEANPKTEKRVLQEAGNVEFERKWLPHQLPIRTERRVVDKNVFTRMRSMVGPLAVLHKCVEERIKLKVWTRHSHGIRGYLIAYITVFDKHWNMALEDVTEVWTRPKKRKIVGLAVDETVALPDQTVLPEIVILQSDKKTETCQRYLEQLFVRGEQIAFIHILNN